MHYAFKNNATLNDFQIFIEKVYALPDDRFYSIWDILSQNQRFAMRALKGIRKEDKEKLKINLLIFLSWLMAIVNRLHINAEEEVWRRFPGLCSYCGHRPCVCKKMKPVKRSALIINNKLRPKSLAGYQTMFDEIYPAQGRTLAESGVHLAEEIGEVSEAIHNFLGQHRQDYFKNIGSEIADVFSCVFGVANSATINLAQELAKIFNKNCHVCHNAPCVCRFSDIIKIRT